MTKRLGMPRLHRDGHIVNHSTSDGTEMHRNVLLQSVEGSDTLGLGETIVLAPVDDQLWGGPLVDEVRWTESVLLRGENSQEPVRVG